MPGQIHSVQVDEEGDAPQPIDCQDEGIPVNIVSLKVLLECDYKRCPDDAEEDD